MQKIEGTVTRKLSPETVSTQKGSFTKQSFVIQTLEPKYSKLICFTAWGDHTDQVSKLKKDERIIVSYTLESREYNSKWYTEAKSQKIEYAYLVNKAKQEAVKEPESDDLPF